MSDTLDLYKALAVAKETALAAGKSLLENFNKFQVLHVKPGGDPTTTADIASERIIKQDVLSAFPSHHFLGEEEGFAGVDSEYTWVVDSLDGTKNYARGLWSYGLNIALYQKEKLVIGVSYFPKVGDLYWASKGQGSFLNGKKITVSEEQDLAKAMLDLDLPHGENRPYEILNTLMTQSFRARSFGIASLGLALVAQGAMEAFVDLSGTSKIWDLAAGILLVEEAGGIVKSHDKISPLKDSGVPSNFLASNRTLSSALGKIMGI